MEFRLRTAAHPADDSCGMVPPMGGGLARRKESSPEVGSNNIFEICLRHLWPLIASLGTGAAATKLLVHEAALLFGRLAEDMRRAEA